MTRREHEELQRKLSRARRLAMEPADVLSRDRGQAGGMRTYAELPGLMTVMTGDEKHGPSATSTLDVLWVLYDQVLRVSPDRLASLNET